MADDFVKDIENLTAPEPPSKKDAPPKRKVTARQAPLKSRVEDAYRGIAFVWMPFDQQCASVLLQQVEPIAEAWDNWARTNPRVREWLERFLTVGAMGELFMAHMPLLIAVATHHGWITTKQMAGLNGNGTIPSDATGAGVENVPE